ncbi:hypothetical protein C7E16_16895, partial [Acinetobacter radioresistens]|uniref:hypothetical protein n=1 Tax=Acinetobacter radioresistens TaxID=40216 RepID=UPI000D45854A
TFDNIKVLHNHQRIGTHAVCHIQGNNTVGQTIRVRFTTVQPVQEEKKPRARKQPKVVEAENVQNSTENEVVEAELTVEDLK